MAPEIMQGDKYNSKVDVWSFGTIFYELVVGFPPFFGKDHQDLAERIGKGYYGIPFGIDLSPECIDFIENCLQFDPDRRMTHNEMLNHPFLKGEKLESFPEIPKSPPNKTKVKISPFASFDLNHKNAYMLNIHKFSISKREEEEKKEETHQPDGKKKKSKNKDKERKKKPSVESDISDDFDLVSDFSSDLDKSKPKKDKSKPNNRWRDKKEDSKNESSSSLSSLLSSLSSDNHKEPKKETSVKKSSAKRVKESQGKNEAKPPSQKTTGEIPSSKKESVLKSALSGSGIADSEDPAFQSMLKSEQNEEGKNGEEIDLSKEPKSVVTSESRSPKKARVATSKIDKTLEQNDPDLSSSDDELGATAKIQKPPKKPKKIKKSIKIEMSSESDFEIIGTGKSELKVLSSEEYSEFMKIKPKV